MKRPLSLYIYFDYSERYGVCMNNDGELIILDTDALAPPSMDGDLWQRRINAYSACDMPGTPKCSIYLLAYNRLHKTKYAVECVLKYTQDVDHELILVDNGSDDGTLDFFQSVQHKNKTIIRVTKNIGSGYPFEHIYRVSKGKYLVCVPNDVYVTKNWLSNLLKCYESDPRIGHAMPVSSNHSNKQQVDLEYSDFDEMQEKAAEYNKSDPAKWEERMRLVNVIAVFPKHVLESVGFIDRAFVHDFGEDDYAARLRHSGYKLILCRDTWVCHDHNISSGEDKVLSEYQKSLDSGRGTFKEKYRGIDAWDDICNFEPGLLSPINDMRLSAGPTATLSVDPKCGTPVLEIRNRLRRRGVSDVFSCAFTTQAKYLSDLLYAADDARCDRIDFIQSHYANDTFDIIALCEPLNMYNSPVTLLQSLCMLLKPNGVLLIKLRNTDNIHTFIRTVGLGEAYDEDFPSALPVKEIIECLYLFGMRNATLVSADALPHSNSDKEHIRAVISAVKGNVDNGDYNRLLAKDFIVMAEKG